MTHGFVDGADCDSYLTVVADGHDKNTGKISAKAVSCGEVLLRAYEQGFTNGLNGDFDEAVKKGKAYILEHNICLLESDPSQLTRSKLTSLKTSCMAHLRHCSDEGSEEARKFEKTLSLANQALKIVTK